VLALGVPSHDTHRSSSYRRPVWARLEIGRGPPALANGRTGVSSRTRSKPHSLDRERVIATALEAVHGYSEGSQLQHAVWLLSSALFGLGGAAFGCFVFLHVRRFCSY
jgi:hypothetical protein